MFCRSSGGVSNFSFSSIITLIKKIKVNYLENIQRLATIISYCISNEEYNLSGTRSRLTSWNYSVEIMEFYSLQIVQFFV